MKIPEKYKDYYRTDIAEQEARKKNVFYFTTEGYARLSELTTQIKNGDKKTAEEFAEITLPWADYIVGRYNKKMTSSVDSGEVLFGAINQIKTNPKVVDFNSFHARFNLVMHYDVIDLRRKISFPPQPLAGAIAEANHAVRWGNGVVHNDPSAHMETAELQAAFARVVQKLSPSERELLTVRELKGKGWLRPTSMVSGINQNTVKAVFHRLPKKLFTLMQGEPLLKDWLEQKRITADDFLDVAEKNRQAVNEQKTMIREIFGFSSEHTLREIAETLNIYKPAISCIFGDGQELISHGALSKLTKEKLCDYLVREGKSEEDIAKFNAAFEKLRELTGVKTQNRGA